MTTSLMHLMNGLKEAVLSKFWLSYFRESYRGEINDQILQAFSESNMTKADIARKLNRRPEQITRWLSAPCNLEADTIADLGVAFGLRPRLTFEPIGAEKSNQRTHDFALRQQNRESGAVIYILRQENTLEEVSNIPKYRTSGNRRLEPCPI